MNDKGFTLVEVIVAAAIIGILAGIATFVYSAQVKKGTIEAQTRRLLNDLLKARADALYQRRPRTVVISGGGLQYAVYSSVATAASVKPVSTVTLKYPLVTSGATPVGFDERGLLMNDPNNTGSFICVNGGSNQSAVDSLVLSMGRVQIGKWTVPGGASSACIPANITR